MIHRMVMLALAVLSFGCADPPTVPSSAPSLRGTITVLGPAADGRASQGDSPGAVRSVVVHPLASSRSAGSLTGCWRDAVLTISDNTRIRRESGEVVGPSALAVGQVVSVWLEPTFPATLGCRPGAVAADILIESTVAP